MNFKNKLFIITLMLILMFSVSVVSAEENTSLTQADDYTFSVENPSGTPDMNQVLETTQSHAVSVKDEGYNEELLLQSNDDVSLKSNANNIIGTGTGTFTELQELINSASDTITLEKDYTYNLETDSSITEGIIINKNLTILGNNHTLDGSNQSTIFKISDSSITIKDLIFINANGYDDGAVYIGNEGDIVLNIVFDNCKFKDNAARWGGAISIDDCQLNFNMSNCDFVNNYAAYTGGAIYIDDADDSNFTIMNCNFMNNSARGGGAIRIDGAVDSNFIIDNCDFVNNSARGGGGAINIFDVVDSNFIIDNCDFVNNSANVGGGGAIDIYVSDNSNFIIDNCDFVNNSANVGGGGAIYIYVSDNSNFIIDNCDFVNNSANDYGGAIRIFDAVDSNFTIMNCNFVNNSANSDGGAIYIYSCDDLNFIIDNCNFMNNSAGEEGGAIYIYNSDNSNFIIDNCDFVNNSAYYTALYYYFGGGGAIYVYGDCEISVVNSTFVNNSVPYIGSRCRGGAIYCDAGNITILDSTFVNNYAGIGGAINIEYGDEVLIDKCIFINNTASVENYKYGGGAINYGMFNNDEPTNIVSNSIFINNTAASHGGAICVHDETGLTAYNCTFINNSAEYGGAIEFQCGYCHNNATFCTFISNSASYGGAMYWECTSNKYSGFTYCIFDNNTADQGRDIYLLDYYADDIWVDTFNYWSMNFTTVEQFINSDIYNIDGDSSYAENWVLMHIYGNDPLKVGNNESFIVVFDKVCTAEGTIESFTGLLPDYWTSVYVYEGQLLASNGLLGAAPNSGVGAEADYNHEWDNENVNVGAFIANIWLRNNTGNFYYTPTAEGPYTFRTHSPFTNWEEAVFTTDAELPVVDLAINKSASSNSVFAGDEVIWTVTVVNNGPDIAFNAFVEDVLPDGLTFVSADPSKGEYDSASGVWTIGNLTDGETVTLTITSVVGEVDSVTNNAFVNSSSVDPDMGNNYANDTVNVTWVADLAINKTASSSIVNVGDEVIWTITVVNNGPNTALNCIVNEILPSGLIYVRGSASKGSYDLSSGIWAIGNLTNGETATLTITTTAQNPGLIENLVNVSSDTYDPDMANNEYAANVTVNNNETIPENNETIPENNETIPNDNVPVPDDVVITPSDDVSIPSDGVVKSIDSKATGNPVFILLLMLFSLVFVSSRKFK